MNKFIITIMLCLFTILGKAQVTQQQIKEKKAEIVAITNEIKDYNKQITQLQALAKSKQQAAKAAKDPIQKKALNDEAAVLISKAKTLIEKRNAVQNILGATKRDLAALEEDYRNQQKKK